MKISFTTTPGNLNLTNGYGNAGYNVSSALKRLGHEVPFKDETAPVEIAFNQPTPWPPPKPGVGMPVDWMLWSGWPGEQYRIIYTPWESSGIPEDWVEAFNNEADEVWTPSPVVAQWFKDAGTEKTVKVYEHGLDPIWTGAFTDRTYSNGPLTFLHHGDPAPRKGGQMALDAFRAAFGPNSKDVKLIMKSYGPSPTRARIWVEGDPDPYNLGAPEEFFNNVDVYRSQTWTREMLVALYRQVDVMVYPGWGEGFGLIPLQGMGAGLPVLCTEAWAPYKDFILPELRIPSKLVDSPWPRMHPGQMFEPDFDALVEMYRFTFDNYGTLATSAQEQQPKVVAHYDWDRLTEEAFAEIVQKFS